MISNVRIIKHFKNYNLEIIGDYKLNIFNSMVFYVYKILWKN